jgi:hypothetical protein
MPLIFNSAFVRFNVDNNDVLWNPASSASKTAFATPISNTPRRIPSTLVCAAILSPATSFQIDVN